MPLACQYYCDFLDKMAHLCTSNDSIPTSKRCKSSQLCSKVAQRPCRGQVWPRHQVSAEEPVPARAACGQDGESDRERSETPIRSVYTFVVPEIRTHTQCAYHTYQVYGPSGPAGVLPGTTVQPTHITKAGTATHTPTGPRNVITKPLSMSVSSVRPFPRDKRPKQADIAATSKAPSRSVLWSMQVIPGERRTVAIAVICPSVLHCPVSLPPLLSSHKAKRER